MTTPKEKFYDIVVAPELLQIAGVCEREGIPFLAICEWEKGKHGTTMIMPAGSSVDMQLVRWAMLARGNADLLIGKMLEYAKKHGSNSAYLSILNTASQR